MCRIFGCSGNDPEALRRMQAPLQPGGPDSVGYYTDEDISLGHRRLSILDLSPRSNQPMEYEHLIISYNGEVYNFQEIKKELEPEYSFTTHSDTEVVLKALHKWGLQAVQKFHGMFAFALWDKKNKKLYLVRDRLGVKPLYYYYDGKNFIFASEIKAMLRHGAMERRIDPQAAAAYFQFGFIPKDLAIFAHTKKLLPGHYLVFDSQKKRIAIQKYWDIPKKRIDISLPEALERTEELLQKSFTSRMVSDVPVGVFLSGGIDSSLLVAYLSKHFKLSTFTIGFYEEKFNEAEIAKKTAEHFGTEHHELYFDIEDLLALLPKITQIFDEPFGDPSALPTFLVAQLAKEHVKVALSADGADELFGGYTINYKNEKRFGLYSKLTLIAPLLDKKRKYLATSDFWRYKLATRYRVYPDELKISYFLDAPECRELLECMYLFDFHYFLSDDVLVKVDRVTMANSLEAREPYLDQDVVEFAWQLPIELRRDKKILRTLLEREIPGELARLPKRGFSIPIKYWLRNRLKDEVLETLSAPSLMDDIVKKEKIVQTFYKSGKRTNAVWLMYMFRRWEMEYLQ